MKYKSLFSYYGGKSKIAHLYPPPEHSLIIEPFAGAASYSLLWHDHDVLLYDVDERVCSIWQFLLSPDALKYIRRLPDKVSQGDTVDDLIKRVYGNASVPEGLVWVLRAECNHGTMGARGKHNVFTKIGSLSWRIKEKAEYFLPRIHHWRFIYGSYENIPNIRSTWFVDPPYNNSSGRRYYYFNLDYSALGKWCRSRKGQVIVCENIGATWLPFRPLTLRRRGIISSYQKSEVGEAIWTKGC